MKAKVSFSIRLSEERIKISFGVNNGRNFKRKQKNVANSTFIKI